MTLAVVTVKDTDACPAGMITEDGTAAAGLLLNKYMVIALEAGPVSETFPVEVRPPTTLAGLTDNVERAAAFTTNELFKLVPRVAVTVPGVSAATGEVVMGTTAESAPAGMVTVAGAVAAGLVSTMVTTAPPAGAGPLILTLP